VRFVGQDRIPAAKEAANGQIVTGHRCLKDERVRDDVPHSLRLAKRQTGINFMEGVTQAGHD